MQIEIIIICRVVFATIHTVQTELWIDSKRSNTLNSPTDDIANAGKEVKSLDANLLDINLIVEYLTLF